MTSIRREHVITTPTFAGLDELQKTLILNKTNIELIANGFNVCNHQGLVFWKTSFFPTARVQGIVKDLRWKITDNEPRPNQNVLFVVHRIARVNNRLKRVEIEEEGVFLEGSFYARHEIHPIQNVIKWQSL